MLVYGAGGHAGVIISLLMDSGVAIKAIFDDNPVKRKVKGMAVGGSYDANLHVNEALILAIGDNATRAQLAAKIGHRFENVFHHSALIDLNVQLGLGNVALHRAIIQADTIIGNHCIINTAATIDHDCRIADFVHIGPGCVLCGNVTVGDCTLVGAGSVVVPNIIIGKNCLIGAGSVVTKNIPDGSIARGNPARIIKQTHYGKENLAFATAHGRDGNDLHSASI